jgi:hypothetical protein
MDNLWRRGILLSTLPPWVRYRELVDLEGAPADSPEAVTARLVMETSPQVMTLLADIGRWPGTVLNSHKSASQTFHSLSLAASLGVSPENAAIATAVNRILERMGPDGMPRLPMNYPAQFGGPGVETWAWALCDAPVILAALVRLGFGDRQQVRDGVGTVLALAGSYGWPCAAAPELGGFRGPGKKTDPCPYATLVSLELASSCIASGGTDGGANSRYAGIASSPGVLSGIEALLSCWVRSREWHPYIFYMGDDFRKLKAPLLWYDILHVTDVLSCFEVARADTRFLDMLGVLRAKRLEDGSYIPESTYQPYKAWDFGQKKTGSPWIGFIVRRIERRLGW